MFYGIDYFKINRKFKIQIDFNLMLNEIRFTLI